jgi:hypothetical protein
VLKLILPNIITDMPPKRKSIVWHRKNAAVPNSVAEILFESIFRPVESSMLEDKRSAVIPLLL